MQEQARDRVASSSSPPSARVDTTRWQMLPAVGRWWGRRSSAFRFGVAGLSLMALFYTVAYYPYEPTSVPGRMLAEYVLLQARLCGALLHLFDPAVSTTGALISGRFPLMIVLDCVAPDSMALYAAAILAFPAPLGRKLIGLVVGLAAVVTVNVGRIALLYLIGLRAPHLFRVMHEEVLQAVIVLSVACCFVAYVRWLRRAWSPAKGLVVREPA